MTVFRQPAALLAAAVLAGVPLLCAQTPIPSAIQPGPAACGVATVDHGKGDSHFPSYLEDSFAQLKAAVPALRNLKFEAHPPTIEHEDESDAILVQTGAIISAMLPRVPNLIAREDLSQVAVPMPYTVNQFQQTSMGGGSRRNAQAQLSPIPSPGLEGEELHKALQSMLASSKNRVTFTYRIRSDPDPTYGTLLNESRVNAQNESVEISDSRPGHPRSVGFGSAWLMFTPNEQQHSRFRYLGQEKIGNRDTYVLAFAQLPDRVTLPSQVLMQNLSCPYFMQGVIWIDQSLFQIVGLQTDLLYPIPGLRLKRLRSELHFSEIHIPERNLTLWMPSDVEISWETKDTASAELHRYSNYRIFGATSRIILPDPE